MSGTEDTGETQRKDVNCFLNLERVCDEDCAAFEAALLGGKCALLNSLKKLSSLSDLWQRATEDGWANRLTGGR